MGRGNPCVHGDYEGLYFVDNNNFYYQPLDEETDEPIGDEEFDEFAWDDFKDQFIRDMMKCTNLEKCDYWFSDCERVFLENRLFMIAFEDDGFKTAIKLLQKEPGDYNPQGIVGLQKRHYEQYLNLIKKCLFEQFEELLTYNGPWMCERIKRNEEEVK